MAKILYLVSEDWFFHSHFLPMARAARDVGLDVVVAARVRAHRTALEAEKIRVVPLESERRSVGPLDAAATVRRMATVIRRERPAIVHAIALRTVVLGGIAARLSGASDLVLAPTGLGHLWIETGPAHRAARAAIRLLVSRGLARGGTRFLFENLEDPAQLGLDPADPRIVIVGGAGVDPAAFPEMPEPEAPPLRVAVVSRMLYPKGIDTAVAAVRLARAGGLDVRLDLYGTPDASNRRSIPEHVLRGWSDEPGIAWRGHAADVAGVWAGNHVAMLLSAREGLPRSLVEAMACGRPVIATDVPGCRTLVRHGIDGLLVSAGDAPAAAAALERLSADPALRRGMGRAAAERVRGEFSEAAVRETVAALYRRMLSAGA